MKFNLKNFPKTVKGENRDEADIWAEGFEKELRFLDYEEWYEKNKLKILATFDLHIMDGLTPNEVLRYFVEKEILGEDKE